MTHLDPTPIDRVEDDSNTESYHVSHQWDRGQSLITTIVYAIADISNTHPCDIPPLGEALEVDALEELLNHLSATGHCTTSYISFPFADWIVTVYATGKIVISVSE